MRYIHLFFPLYIGQGQQYSNKGDDEEAEDFIIRDDTSKVATVRPSISLSLPVGQKIKIKALGSKQFEKSKLSSDTNSSIINNHDIPNPNTGPSSADKSIVVGEDEWGDFESAS